MMRDSTTNILYHMRADKNLVKIKERVKTGRENN